MIERPAALPVLADKKQIVTVKRSISGFDTTKKFPEKGVLMRGAGRHGLMKSPKNLHFIVFISSVYAENHILVL